MPRTSSKVDAVWAQQLAAELKRLGHPVDEILTRAGLEERSLDADGARILLANCTAFFELAAEATGDDRMGFRFGKTRSTRDAGLIGYVGLSSPTLLDAIKNFHRYGRVFNEAVEIDINELESHGRMGWRFGGVAPEAARQMLEFSVTNLLRAFREMTGREIMPVTLAFAASRSEHIDEFEQYFGCEIRFGGQTNVVEINTADLFLDLVNADHRLLKVLRRYCEDLLARHEVEPPPLVSRVERLIVDRMAHGEAKLDMIATEIGMSPRSLSRKLAELDTSFSGIVDNIRKELARRYLNENNLSVTEIAFLLGYSEVSTFNHAYRRWTGNKPTEDRRAASG